MEEEFKKVVFLVVMIEFRNVLFCESSVSKNLRRSLAGYYNENDQQMAKKLMKRCSALVVNEGK